MEERGGQREGARMIDTWINNHRQMYDRATRHPFVLSIRDGSVDSLSFKRWLGQDYIFVRQFVPFLASVLLKACRESEEQSDVEVLLGGIASLHDELSWFKKEASKWDVMLNAITPQKANQDYCRFLESLMLPEVDYTVAITAFWAIESVYQKSFSLCLEASSNTPAELMETCQRWGNDGFGQYCCALRGITERRLGTASEDVMMMAEGVFVRVLESEVRFWDMSYGE
ncbi:hypothetical protein QJS10_CPA05g00233 [Acorus calamus]|uniref:aminopyrimidine aminohydrolase n=1 Tax=Acorus calamus TaxID=4465 RepID=A0AAV9F055_ACOCL|nr:hypothetical protein QJS10_CPA05g00233 [Acorus calamus]